jgi:hypothetical protein
MIAALAVRACLLLVAIAAYRGRLRWTARSLATGGLT